MKQASARPLVLASGSPRRRELLGQLAVPFQITVSDAPETLDPRLSPEAQAIALAERKARAVAADYPNCLVLAADTIVVLDGEILGKPTGDSDAARMLRQLSGREHLVITGLVLLDAARDASWRAAVTSRVRFRHLSDGEIATYVATGETRDKAGAYAIQGIGSALIAGLDGCRSNVVGLPLCEVAALLEMAGVAIPPGFAGCRLADGTLCPRLV
jgi:septum formation protein